MREVTTDLPLGYRLYEDGDDLYLYREGELLEMVTRSAYDHYLPTVLELRLLAFRDAYEDLVGAVDGR